MKKVLVVHTKNKKDPFTIGGAVKKFNDWYFPEYDNTDRLTIVGIPNEETKTLTIGVSFCSNGDNFNRSHGRSIAYIRATGFRSKPYAVVELDEFSQEACLNVLYAIHDELVKLSVKEVKKLVNKQIIK